MDDTTIHEPVLGTWLEGLEHANRLIADRFPGEGASRQPVHTVYGGAHLFKADVAGKLGGVALRMLRDHAPDGDTLAAAIGCDRALAARIHPRIVEKLTREPIEDLRIDFEDGFGIRAAEEEDRVAQAAADEVAAGLAGGTLPPAIGIRIKPLSEELKHRSMRTLDLFLTRLVQRTGGALPPNFVITLPKITTPKQVGVLAAALERFESARGIPAGSLQFELMVETTQAIFAIDGTVALPHLVAAGSGRVVGAHFGVYDYTASCNITAQHQHMLHPAADFARHVMQVALAGTAVRLSDSVTNIMPIGPHRAQTGVPLTAAQIDENRRVVHRAWRLHAEHVRHSLVNGFYQGWDLHPGQFVSRYATVYGFFLEGLEETAERLRSLVGKATQASMVGDVFDDAATGQGLLNYFLRAVSCGAMTEQEAVEASGLTLDELRSKSFVKILNNRAR